MSAYNVTKVEGLWNDPDFRGDRTAEWIVEVHTTGPRGGAPMSWLVHYNRHGVLAYAYRDTAGQAFFTAQEVPPTVAQAAEKVWLTSPAWVARRWSAAA